MTPKSSIFFNQALNAVEGQTERCSQKSYIDKNHCVLMVADFEKELSLLISDPKEINI